jgi:hypothetical protein
MILEEDRSDIREQLAALEHDQWAHWTQHMLQVLFPQLFDGSQAPYPHPSVKRWLSQIRTPYEALSEEEKASDRHWADKVLEILDAPTKLSTQPVVLVEDSRGVSIWHIAADPDGIHVRCGQSIPGSPLVLRRGEAGRVPRTTCIHCIERAATLEAP